MRIFFSVRQKYNMYQPDLNWCSLAGICFNTKWKQKQDLQGKDQGEGNIVKNATENGRVIPKGRL